MIGLLQTKSDSLFRVIKAVANLPKVTYILAFDKDIVASALSTFHERSGSDYLEKIVQVPFELPLPDKPSLRKLLFERIDLPLAPLDATDFDQQYWSNIFFDGIDWLIETPRDITRLANTLAVTFSAVRGEVNPVDFIAIEAIRVFAPNIYHIIRQNPGEFTGHSKGYHQENKKSFHEAYIGALPPNFQTPLQNLLQRLFPKLQRLWSNVFYDAESEPLWRRDLRVCSKEVFPIYFRLEIPEWTIGVQEIRRNLEHSGNSHEFASILKSLGEVKAPTGMTRAHVFLQRLEDFTQDAIPKDHIRPILFGLFDAADMLLIAEPDRGFMDFGVSTQIGRIVWRLLRRLELDERVRTLEELVDFGGSLALIVREVAVLGQMHGKYSAKEKTPDHEQLVSLETQESLEKRAALRIARDAESGNLLVSPSLAEILQSWKEWQETDDCDRWVAIMLNDPKFLISLVSSAMSVGYSHSIGHLGDRAPRINYHVNLPLLSRFIDVNSARSILERIIEEAELSDRERLALKTFVNTVEGDSRSG